MPAQASRAVKNGPGRLNSFLTVAGIDECSYCDVAVGPFAACKTATKQTKPNKLLPIIMSFLQQLTSFTNEDTQTDSRQEQEDLEAVIIIDDL